MSIDVRAVSDAPAIGSPKIQFVEYPHATIDEDLREVDRANELLIVVVPEDTPLRHGKSAVHSGWST